MHERWCATAVKSLSALAGDQSFPGDALAWNTFLVRALLPHGPLACASGPADSGGGLYVYYTHTRDLINIHHLFLWLWQVIALGGDAIPARVVRKWARDSPQGGGKVQGDLDTQTGAQTRLYVMYGVTEACVYQTTGEIFRPVSSSVSHDAGFVGSTLPGVQVRICCDSGAGQLMEVSACGEGGCDGEYRSCDVGEIVLEGEQIDHLSGYYHHNLLLPLCSPVAPFVLNTWPDGTTSICYRTGDRGFISHSITSQKSSCSHTISDGIKRATLNLVGRISGAPRMVKVNGIRVDPVEVEESILEECPDSADISSLLGLAGVTPLVVDCAVVFSSNGTASGAGFGSGSGFDTDNSPPKKLVAYFVLSEEAEAETGWGALLSESGVVVPTGPLLTLLHTRCVRRLKHGVVPAVYVCVREIPVTATGKRNLTCLPDVAGCRGVEDVGMRGDLLMDRGGAGAALAREVITCLNLQPCQYSSVTAKVGGSFVMLYERCDVSSSPYTHLLSGIFCHAWL